MPNTAAVAVMDHPLLGLGVLVCSALAAGTDAFQSIPSRRPANAMKYGETRDVRNPRTSSNFAGKNPILEYFSLR